MEVPRHMAGMAVLVVEDDRDIRELVRMILEEELQSVRIVLARDGEEALRLVRAARPALVLLDLSLPNLDGFGVLRRFRADPATEGIPVIAVTARDELRR